jgi:hypothetical protein
MNEKLLSRLDDLEGKVRQIKDQMSDSKPGLVRTALER